LIRNGQVTAFCPEHGIDDEIRALHMARDGALWIGTAYGLHVYRVVNVIYRDRRNNLWVGTRSDGLYRYTQGRWTNFATAHGLSNNFVQALGEDREGSLWIATSEGLNRLRDVKIVPFTTKEGLAHDSVMSLAEAADRSLYLFNNGAPFYSRMKDGVIANLPGPGGPSYAAKDGSAWVAGVGGLKQIQDGRVRRFLPELKQAWK
jgi:ligand-binding sensor domain-containing protein